jgi:hypothetical protein
MANDIYVPAPSARLADAGADAVIEDRVPRLPGTLTTVAPNQVDYDPVFGSRFLRVTDPWTDGEHPGISYRSPDSSVQRGWNSNSTRFLIKDTFGRFHWFALNRRLVRATWRGILPVSGDCSWHDRDPDLVYGRYGSRVVKVYNVKKNTIQTIVDLDELGLNLGETYTGNIYVQNDTLLVAFGGAINDLNHYVRIIPLDGSEPRTLDTATLTQYNQGRGFTVHGSVLDLSARYALIQPAYLSQDTAHLYVWDWQADSLTQVSACVSGHFAVGWQQWVNQDVASGPWDAAQWVRRDFQTPNTVQNVLAQVLTPQEVYLADHSSWTNATSAQTEPYLTATYRYAPSDVPWRAWDDELLTIDAVSGRVRRHAHHRSQVQLPDGGWEFYATPRPNIAPDGRWAIYTSNRERSLGTDAVQGSARQDVFLVELR